MVKRILVSQQPPKVVAPYETLKERYGVQFEFRPFFVIEPVSIKEFRTQRISILDFTAIVFSARSTIDAFFHVCEELRVRIPETMKYFCTTEVVAMYLQKHIVYRKRKIFFGEGSAESVVSQIGTKHKGEKFLITTSDSPDNDITRIFAATGLEYQSAIFVKSVPQNLKDIGIHSYDMLVLYNKADVKSIIENFPDFKQDGLKMISYGKSAEKAMKEAGWEVAVSAPSAEVPSVAKAVEVYLQKNYQ